MNFKQTTKKAKNKAIYFGNHISSHWNRPAPGHEAPYREVAAYSVGGMGKEMIMYMVYMLALNASTIFLGSTIGIKPMHIQTMYTIVTILNVGFVFVRAFLFDNMRLKMGKFRPMIMLSAIPLVAIIGVMFFLEFDVMTYKEKLTAVIAFVICVEFFKPILLEAFVGIGHVITSNSNERTNIITIYSIVYSLAPTLTNFIVPLFSEFTGGLTSIDTYRYVILPMALFGVVLSLVTVLGTKERIVTSRNYVQKVNVFKGIKEVYRNKYWWIINCAGWVAFLEGAANTLLLWMYVYGVQDMVEYSMVTTVLGMSATIAMVLTPILLKKVGNKNLLLLHNSMNIVLIVAMLFTFQIPYLFIFFLFFNLLFNYLALIYGPVIHGEMRDYQHYLSGKRMDGVFGPASSMINTPIIIATGYIIPIAYQSFGLTINYNILYDPSFRNQMFTVLLVMSIVGAVLNLVPFFFYDFPREMHVNVVRVNNLRAMIGDYSDDCLQPERIKRGVDDHREVMRINSIEHENINDLRKQLRLLNADKTMAKEEKKNQSKQMYAHIVTAKNIAHKQKHTVLYLNEFHKFDIEINKIKLVLAHELCDKGIESFSGRDALEMKESVAKAVGRYCADNCVVLTPKEKRSLNAQFRGVLRSHKKMNKVYDGNFKRMTMDNLNEAIAMPETNKEEEKARKIALKREGSIWSKYINITENYRDTKMLIKQKIAMDNFAEIEGMYEDSILSIEDGKQKSIIEEQERKAKVVAYYEATEKIRIEEMPLEKQEKYLIKKEKQNARKEQMQKMIEEAVATEKKSAEAKKQKKLEMEENNAKHIYTLIDQTHPSDIKDDATDDSKGGETL